MSSNWQRVRVVFHAALELPADARADYLARTCGEEEDTRREVESLLTAHRGSEGFLERPALELTRERDALPALQPGDRVGNFEIIGSLGTGGMGEVYRARDAQLRREVAVKLLPRAVADDPQRLARFDRESRILATLNHPHIATIHSVESAHDLNALVMELVEGPTLDERVRRGPLPWSEALAIARELAAALEAAHEKGVVHRDLKPANVRFTASGSLKLLDFGLAKAGAEHEPPMVGSAPAPTSVTATADGVIVGTCAYMSPEQARGLAVDKRTDVWAFGCLLFEMLAGKRAFAGKSVAEIITAVLERDPDWAALPDAIPHGIRRLLRRCLEKDPHRRLHDIADARIEIDDAMQADDPVARVLGQRRARNRMLLVASVIAVSAASLGTGWWLRAEIQQTSPPRVMPSTWDLPAGAFLNSAPVVSPDGQRLAFIGSAEGQPTRVWVRPLNTLDAHSIPGTDGAQHPFWSPDGRTLGYFSRGRLMKVAIAGGTPVEIASARDGRGGTWSRNGVIVFSPDLIDSGLVRVSADGGDVQSATLLDLRQGENSHRWPVFLPDGIHFVYFVRSTRADRRGVYVGRVDRPAVTPGQLLFRSESEAQYVPLDRDRGVLLSAADGHVEVRPFDAQRLVLTGDPRTIAIPASALTPYHPSMFTASSDVLAYVSGHVPYGQRFASVARDGTGLTVRQERQILNWPRLSLDGRRIVYQGLDGTAGSPDLWVEDLDTGRRLKLTKEGASGGLPVWSRDGSRVAYVTGSISKSALIIAAADGTGPTFTVPCPGVRCFPADWSPDGQWLLATVHFAIGVDVWQLPIDGRSAARPLLAESFVERDPRFSPGGDLVAYVSEETGAPEVSIQRIDGAPARDVISVGGGDQPVWGPKGKELFFVDPQGLLHSVSVRHNPGARPVFGKPVRLNVPSIGFGHFGTQYDVSPHGDRIYFFDRRRDPLPSEIGLVLGWSAPMNQ